MKPLCVIPARRGSKRIPEKNIRLLCGKPMLAYSIEAALASQVFGQVYVSTEDLEIATIAESYGAVAHMRPIALSGDLVSATEVCIELYEARQRQGENSDVIVCLQPTSPLRSSRDIQESLQIFGESQADFLVSVTPIDPHFFHWAVHTPPGERFSKMFFEDRFLVERPLLPPVFRPNGAIKIGRVEDVRRIRNFFGPHLVTYQMPEERSIHIGEPLDWKFAEFLLLQQANPDLSAKVLP